MPPPGRPDRQQLTRADLPTELTPESLRHLGFRTLRQLARPDNGVLDADEQRQFDAALAELRQGAASLVDMSLQRARRGEPDTLDPAMRRSYQRTQQRLAQQAERARRRLPDLDPASDVPQTPLPDTSTPVEETSDDDVSPDTLEHEVEQTSDTLDMLERIASLQQQLLEHQQGQMLSETRGLFFAFLVSVAVIVAGVAPLVEATSHDRLVIVIWTVAATAAAGVSYAVVRAWQVRKN